LVGCLFVVCFATLRGEGEGEGEGEEEGGEGAVLV